MKGKGKNNLRDRYCAPTEEVLTFFALRGYTLRETAERLDVKYSTLKTWAWEMGISFSNGKDAIDRFHTITYNGQEFGIKELADLHEMNWKTLSDRLRNGWEVDEAINTPVREGNWKFRQTRIKDTISDFSAEWLRRKWK